MAIWDEKTDDAKQYSEIRHRKPIRVTLEVTSFKPQVVSIYDSMIDPLLNVYRPDLLNKALRYR